MSCPHGSLLPIYLLKYEISQNFKSSLLTFKGDSRINKGHF